MTELDDPSRGTDLGRLIQSKSALKAWYEDVYERYADVLTRCPPDGTAIELGAGAGFSKQRIPELITSDVINYPMVDLVFDAREMPFPDEAVRFIGMLNVLHHVCDAEAFLRECERCLSPGGRMLIVDQYPGWLSHWILRFAHHEPYNPAASSWSFPSTGPLSGANGALAWIIFFRDRQRFEQTFPALKIASIRRHSPLRYWLAGGLKTWSLLPGFGWKAATRLDEFLSRWIPQSASFMDIELVKCSDADRNGQASGTSR